MKLRTPKEAGERLGVSPLTVIRLFDDGTLPGVIVRHGARKRIIRFREETLEKFIRLRERRLGRIGGRPGAAASGIGDGPNAAE